MAAGTNQDSEQLCFPARTRYELGLAMLIAEFADGTHQPVNVVSPMIEACDVAQEHCRMATAGKRPTSYVVWARGVGGEYFPATRITP